MSDDDGEFSEEDDSEEESDDNPVVSNEKLEELIKQAAKTPPGGKKANGQKTPNQQQKKGQDKTKESKTPQGKQQVAAGTKTPQTQGKDKQQQQKKTPQTIGQKTEQKQQQVKTPQQQQSTSKTPQKRKLPSGITVEELKEGHGPEAKNNKMVHVYYTGKLSNGKQFDSTTSGKPFKFRLGKNEVIKGWELGLQGMKVGGKRRLTIPPNLAYGNDKSSGLPPNSTLHFDVELKGVN